ncbi:unnamed protein product, partial [Phaeothamnion confervicola]
AKRLQPCPAVVSLPELLDKCRIVLEGYPKEVPLEFLLDDDVPTHVLTDGNWLWQMAVNLLTNACKFTCQGYVRLTVTVQETDDDHPLRGSYSEGAAADTGAATKAYLG